MVLNLEVGGLEGVAGPDSSPDKVTTPVLVPDETVVGGVLGPWVSSPVVAAVF